MGILTILLLSHSVVSNSVGPPWTVAHHAPLSVGFPRQEYWSIPFPGDISDLGIEPASPTLHVGSLSLSHLGSPLTVLILLIHEQGISLHF